MRLIFLGALLLAAPAVAEVKSATDAGFEVARTETIAADPAAIYAALRTPNKWWNAEHTWSGDAANLWIDAQAGGCFCEKMPDKGSIQHARIVAALPGKQLRLTGALGPLQAEAVTGTFTWDLKPVDGGTEVTQSYVVGGYVRTGASALAPAVDQVLGEQLTRLKAFIEAPAD